MIEPMHLYPEEKERLQEAERQGYSVNTCNNWLCPFNNDGYCVSPMHGDECTIYGDDEFKKYLDDVYDERLSDGLRELTRSLMIMKWGREDTAKNEIEMTVTVNAEDIPFTFAEYQRLAARTMNFTWSNSDQEMHALHGMVGELGELHSIYQKRYQGHMDTDEHKKKELGDLLWFVAEYCTAKGWELSEIAEMNIDKLKKRYPDGFDAERSLHRKAGDI